MSKTPQAQRPSARVALCTACALALGTPFGTGTLLAHGTHRAGAGVDATGQAPSPVSPSALELIDPALVDALTAALASTLRDPATRDATLLSLRRLRDPTLRPLLVGLSIAPDPQLQLHGLLGLAELDDRRRIDLLSIRQLPTASWRSAVVREGFAEGLIDDALIPEVCAWPDLDAGVHVRLAARLATNSTASIQPQQLVPMLDDDRPEVAVLAAILLEQAQDPLDPPTRARRTLVQRLGAPGGLPSASALRIIQAAADARLTSAGDAVSAIAASSRARQRAALDRSLNAGQDRALRSEAQTARDIWAGALGAGIVVAPQEATALKAFAQAWTSADSDDRAALALAALDVARRLGPETPRALADVMDNAGNLAQTSIADAVRALASDGTVLGEGAKPGNPPTTTDRPTPAPAPTTSPPDQLVRLSVPVAVVRVLSSGDPDLAAWAMRVAADRPAQDAAEIRSRVLALALGELRAQTRDGPLRALGIEAAAELAQDDAARVLALLRDARAQGETDVCGLLLLGLLRSASGLGMNPSDALATSAQADPSALLTQQALADPTAWPSTQCATLALVLACRTGVVQPTDPATRARLTAVALDAEHQGTLAPEVRAMAAWLALRGLGADRVALARMLSQ